MKGNFPWMTGKKDKPREKEFNQLFWLNKPSWLWKDFNSPFKPVGVGLAWELIPELQKGERKQECFHSLPVRLINWNFYLIFVEMQLKSFCLAAGIPTDMNLYLIPGEREKGTQLIKANNSFRVCSVFETVFIISK